MCNPYCQVLPGSWSETDLSQGVGTTITDKCQPVLSGTARQLVRDRSESRSQYDHYWQVSTRIVRYCQAVGPRPIWVRESVRPLLTSVNPYCQVQPGSWSETDRSQGVSTTITDKCQPVLSGTARQLVRDRSESGSRYDHYWQVSTRIVRYSQAVGPRPIGVKESVRPLLTSVNPYCQVLPGSWSETDRSRGVSTTITDKCQPVLSGTARQLVRDRSESGSQYDHYWQVSTRIVRYSQAVGPRPIGVRESVRPLLTSVNPYCQVLPGSWSETDRSRGVSTTVTDKCQPVLSGTARQLVRDRSESGSQYDRYWQVSTRIVRYSQAVGPRPIGVRESVRPLLTSVNPYCQVLPGSWSETDRSQGVSTTITDKCQPVLSGTARQLVRDRSESGSQYDCYWQVSTRIVRYCQAVGPRQIGVGESVRLLLTSVNPYCQVQPGSWSETDRSRGVSTTVTDKCQPVLSGTARQLVRDRSESGSHYDCYWQVSTRIVRYCQAVGPRQIGVRESVRLLLTSVNPYCQVLPGSWSDTDRSQGVSTTVTDKCQPVLSGTARQLVRDRSESGSQYDRYWQVSARIVRYCQAVGPRQIGVRESVRPLLTSVKWLVK